MLAFRASRLALRGARLRGPVVANAALTRSVATVSDVTVNCTFIKPNGKRVTVPGRVGWSLLKTAQHHDVGLEGWEASSSWLEDYGEGPATTADHVVVANEWADKLEPIYPEEEKLLQTVDHAVENSRLAAVIKLRKELDGITVYIPPENMSFKGYNF